MISVPPTMKPSDSAKLEICGRIAFRAAYPNSTRRSVRPLACATVT